METFVNEFAAGMVIADHRWPQAVSVRTKKAFRPGIGPHTEAQTVELVMAELESRKPDRYRGRWSSAVPYPESPRQRCDICLGTSSQWEWAIEVKMLRLLGDNGKLNDNMLMHLLSPYPAHRSSLSDCEKLLESRFAGRMQS